MRVAILSVEPVSTHGWGRYTRDLITALASIGIDITLITSINAPLDPQLPVAAYHRVLPPLTPAPRFSSLRLLASVPTVSRLIRSADVVHVIAEPYTLAVPITRRVVVTAHGTYLPSTAQRRGIGAIYRYAYKRAKVICVSRYTEKVVCRVVPTINTTVIPNGVDFQHFQQTGTLQSKRVLTVISVGQVKARKGFHILAKAMRQVREAIPAAEAVFIGDTSDVAYKQLLETQIASDGLTNAVHILGRVPDDVLLGWYHSADVFALPAINTGQQFEGFGLVYLEANAAGLPAIGTIGCGAEDAIRDGETGLLVPQNDVDATASALIKVLKDDSYRQQLSADAIKYAQSHTWEQIAQRVLEVYRSLLE